MDEEVNRLEKVLENREEELLAKSEVSLVLNSYDDIFSSLIFKPSSSFNILKISSFILIK